MENLLFVKNGLILANNPFFDAYNQTDLLGKLIFISLIIISVLSWVIILNKVLETRRVRQQAQMFKNKFNSVRQNPLSLEVPKQTGNPFLVLYSSLKRQTLDLLKKNRQSGENISYLTPPDIDYVDAHLQITMASLVRRLEQNLYILATIIPLAPFLGLLGTVWGILTNFGEMQSQAMGSSQQAVLGGLSLALTTTVLGLVDAIPALIGYNYLKNTIRDFHTEMDGFSTDLLSTVEIQYRKVEVS